MYPVHANPRLAVGEPVTNDYLKCRLAPLRRSDYSPPVTDAQLAQLRAIFPTGVCDYGRPPAGQVSLKSTWLSYPSPGHSLPINLTGRQPPPANPSSSDHAQPIMPADHAVHIDPHWARPS